LVDFLVSIVIHLKDGPHSSDIDQFDAATEYIVFAFALVSVATEDKTIIIEGGVRVVYSRHTRRLCDWILYKTKCCVELAIAAEGTWVVVVHLNKEFITYTNNRVD